MGEDGFKDSCAVEMMGKKMIETGVGGEYERERERERGGGLVLVG